MISNPEILQLLDDNEFVRLYEVLDFYEDKNGYLLKIKVYFIDQSILFSSEYFSKEIRKYSFHWQDKNNNLIIRWDNAPYHNNIVTFPHHKHIEDKVLPSTEIGLEEVIRFICSSIEDHK